MSEPIIHIARDGVKIDMQQLAEIIRLFDAGTFKPTDHYWMSGMAEWGSLKDLIAKSRTPPPLPQDNAPKPAWMTPPKHLQYGDFDPPATDNQREYLLCFGVTIPANLTKYDASRWLDLLTDSPEACEYRDKLQVERISEQWAKNTEEGKHYSHGFKTFSGHFRSEYNAYMEDGDKSGAKEQMKFRADTWHELIKLSINSPLQDLFIYGEFQSHPESLCLLYEHASVFKVCPTKKQIKDMLKKLDDESATWDDDTPELLLRRLLEEQTKIQP